MLYTITAKVCTTGIGASYNNNTEIIPTVEQQNKDDFTNGLIVENTNNDQWSK